MSETVTIHDAKTNFSRLIARAEAGEEIIIARGKTPVARLAPLQPQPPKRRTPGRFAGVFPVPPDSFFFDPLPEDELKLWEGRGDE
ncbi:type II toxin-antitoxin system prevent-host-death family antitoxin [Terrarubrum flagellatum]|uniref:type II toxin-antitoxin system Phd/YefM family antitoxin n=1 Tax=Terrirubrum flagellatum TaxID=2895980 RepID=UPI003144FA5D